VLGVLFCRFGPGWIGGLVWGAFGSGLALVCVGLVRRTQWWWVVRLLGSLGLTGRGYFVVFIALGVSFSQWWPRSAPSEWGGVAPAGGVFTSRCRARKPWGRRQGKDYRQAKGSATACCLVSTSRICNI